MTKQSTRLRDKKPWLPSTNLTFEIGLRCCCDVQVTRLTTVSMYIQRLQQQEAVHRLSFASAGWQLVLCSSVSDSVRCVHRTRFVTANETAFILCLLPSFL